MKHISNDNRVFAKRAIWIAFLAGMSIPFSFALACATPFPALAALAVLHMQRRDVFIVTITAWLANQFIGYVFLHYPPTMGSFAWGLMIGMAALAATEAAIATQSLAPRARLLAPMFAFGAAFIAYEGVLYATGIVASDTGGFSLAIVGWIFWVNILAFAGLLTVHGIGRMLGVVAPATSAAS